MAEDGPPCNRAGEECTSTAARAAAEVASSPVPRSPLQSARGGNTLPAPAIRLEWDYAAPGAASLAVIQKTTARDVCAPPSTDTPPRSDLPESPRARQEDPKYTHGECASRQPARMPLLQTPHPEL